MSGYRADSLAKGAASIIFLDDEAGSDHGISGGDPAQLLQAGEQLAVAHRCRCCNGDDSGDVGSGDDGGSKSSSDGPAAVHQHEQDRLGRAGVVERARSSESDESAASAASAAFTYLLHFFCLIQRLAPFCF